MKSVIALLVVVCLAVSVYGQVGMSGAASARSGGISPAMMAALSRGGGSGMNNIMLLSALNGGMGKYNIVFYVICFLIEYCGFTVLYHGLEA